MVWGGVHQPNRESCCCLLLLLLLLRVLVLVLVLVLVHVLLMPIEKASQAYPSSIFVRGVSSKLALAASLC